MECLLSSTVRKALLSKLDYEIRKIEGLQDKFDMDSPGTRKKLRELKETKEEISEMPYCKDLEEGTAEVKKGKKGKKEKKKRKRSAYQQHMSDCLKGGESDFKGCVAIWNQMKEA